MPRHPKDPAWKRYAYGWVTLGFFLVSLVGGADRLIASLDRQYDR